MPLCLKHNIRFLGQIDGDCWECERERNPPAGPPGMPVPEIFLWVLVGTMCVWLAWMTP